MTKSFLRHVALFCLALAAVSCASRYSLTGVERSRIVVDAAYDRYVSAEATDFIRPFKASVDSIMSPVVGQAARDMASHRPESELSNLLADILLWGAERFGEHPDFAVYNMGGIRASFSKGDVTIGDVLDVAPFENKICFLTLTGSKVEELFQEMAKAGGEGLSRGANIVITRDGQLRSASVGGQPLRAEATYRIATLDYLAQGNDGLEAFKSKTDVVSPQGEDNNVRHFIEDYFREQARQGQAVDSRVEGRTTVVE